MSDRDRPRYMISVAAELVGMHPQTLRIYEQKGLVRPQRTAGNTRLYSDADVERLSALLKEQFTQLTGGPAVYSGRDMKSAHQDMGLHNADFNALAEDLQKAMDQNHVPARAQNKLLGKLAPMEKQIVTK